MKLVYSEMDSHLQFEDGIFPSLVIENPAFFYRFVEDLYRQSIGESGGAVLSIDDKPVPIAGNLDLTANFFPFEMNRKNLLAKISAELEKQALSPEFYECSQQLAGQVEQWAFDLAFSAGVDLEFPRLSVSSLLKSGGACIKDDFSSLPEKLLCYINLVSGYGLAKVFAFVNIRSILDRETMELFTGNCCKYGFNILLIDNFAYEKLSKEQRTVIDADLCEF